MAHKQISSELVSRQEKQAKEVIKAKKAKDKKSETPKRSKIKETFSELKKVSWPSFKKTMAQTGMVISVVAIFMLLVLGFDTLISLFLSIFIK